MNGQNNCTITALKDYWPEPLVVDIERMTNRNPNYRTALWTGKYLQVTLMSIPVGGEIGLEMHPDLDQFLRIENGMALITMGTCKTELCYRRKANGNYAVLVPAGTWHNVINIGNTPLKLYSIYAPPQHPFGTVQRTIQDAE